MNVELVVFIGYLVFMLGIGVFFFLRSRGANEKDYFLGGRKMGPWVSALSAGASDMSAWVLMGLPASVYAFGVGKAWIAIGLAIGYTLSWIFVAPRLRRYSIAANPNSGTIMDLVENAWGVFGTAFGPVILLALFWRRLSFPGAAAGIVAGAGVDILWLSFLGSVALYEIIPGFVAGLLVAIVVSLLTKAPKQEVLDTFDRVAKSKD